MVLCHHAARRPKSSHLLRAFNRSKVIIKSVLHCRIDVLASKSAVKSVPLCSTHSGFRVEYTVQKWTVRIDRFIVLQMKTWFVPYLLWLSTANYAQWIKFTQFSSLFNLSHNTVDKVHWSMLVPFLFLYWAARNTGKLAALPWDNTAGLAACCSRSASQKSQ